jgi:hypothetical protein
MQNIAGKKRVRLEDVDSGYLFGDCSHSPLAHGATRQEGNLEDLFHASRMAGAMNVLIGATIGYSGLAVLSQIEGSRTIWTCFSVRLVFAWSSPPVRTLQQS